VNRHAGDGGPAFGALRVITVPAFERDIVRRGGLAIGAAAHDGAAQREQPHDPTVLGAAARANLRGV
jgi:hypothetical protein